MKQALSFILAFIHVIACSTLAREVALEHGWNSWMASGAWLIGGAIGLVPVVRTIAILAAVFHVAPFSRAIWVGPLLVIALAFFENVGTTMMKVRKF